MKGLFRFVMTLATILCLAVSAASAAALPVKALSPKQVDVNPYMAKSDANIHHDGYNTDSTDEVLPVGIYPEINVSYETTNANASPAIYFDSYGHAVVPLLGGIAIRDLNAEETKTLGYFSPKQHDGGGYMIQSSYTFLDQENRIVCPTSNNHVLMLRATDEAGNVLPEFEKVLDIDIKAAAETALGKALGQNLLSVVFDYEGNLWFATGGFRIYPQRAQQGVMGYIARSAIDAILNGETVDLAKAVYVCDLPAGEGAENGIAASREGAVILTNQNCYLMDFYKDGNGVAFGKVAESSGKVEFGWPVVLSTPLGVDQGGTGATTASNACAKLGAVKKSGDTMTGNLSISGYLYPSVYLLPTYNSTTNRTVFEGSYVGASSFASWQDSSGNNRRMLEVRNAAYEAGRDNALVLRDVVDGSYYTYRVFHAGMATPVPIANGGTGANSAANARANIGANNASNLTAGTVPAARLPFKVAYGSTSISGSSSVTINYSSAGFTSVPKVLVTYSTTSSNWSGDNGAIKVHSKTTTQASIVVGGSFNTSRNVDWLAIGT